MELRDGIVCRAPFRHLRRQLGRHIGGQQPFRNEPATPYAHIPDIRRDGVGGEVLVLEVGNVLADSRAAEGLIVKPGGKATQALAVDPNGRMRKTSHHFGGNELVDEHGNG